MKGFFLVFMAALFGYKFNPFLQQSNGEPEPVLPRAAIRDVVAGHDHDELDTGDHLRHGSCRWVST
jgi:hypothetical protein